MNKEKYSSGLMRPWHVVVAAAFLFIIASTVWGAGKINAPGFMPWSVGGLVVNGANYPAVLLQPAPGATAITQCNSYVTNTGGAKGCYFQSGSWGPGSTTYWQWGMDNNNNWFIYDFKNGGKDAFYLQSGVGVTIGETGGTNPMPVTLQGSQINLQAPAKLQGYTVSTLPSGSIGEVAYVTDATSCSYGGSLTGGGSTYCKVQYNGSSWVGG
jgi:hypothetical protein